MPADARPKTADIFFAGNIRDSAVRRQGRAGVVAVANAGLRLDLPTGRPVCLRGDCAGIRCWSAGIRLDGAIEGD